MENKNYIEKTILSWDELHHDALQLCEMIETLSNNWAGIISVTRGGLFPALIISNKLNIRMINTICLKSYVKKQQEEIELVKYPKLEEDKGKNWLVVDDLVDTGNTLKYIRNLLPNAMYAVIYAKPIGHIQTNMYVRHIPQDSWIVFPWDKSDDIVN